MVTQSPDLARGHARPLRLGAFAGTVTSASDAPGCMAHFDKKEYYYNSHVTGHVRANEFKICVTSQKAPTTTNPPTKAPTGDSLPRCLPPAL